MTVYAEITYATLGTVTTTDVYVDKTLNYCGWGNTANKPKPSNKLLCTDLYGTAATTCSTNTNIICTQWPQRDNNLCPGDYGGPLYLFSGTAATVVGIAAYSPDIKANAHCTDGHAVEHTQVAAYTTWITTTMAAG